MRLRYSLDPIVDRLTDKAITLWETDGHIITTSWVVGRRRAMFAQPITDKAKEIPVAVRSTLTAIMSACCSARFVGQIDEAMVKDGSEDEDLRPGDLWRNAETDPSIHRAVVVAGFDLKRNKGAISRAMLNMNEEGHPTWDRRISRISGNAPTMEALLSAVARNAGATGVPIETILPYFYAAGWTAIEVGGRA